MKSNLAKCKKIDNNSVLIENFLFFWFMAIYSKEFVPYHYYKRIWLSDRWRGKKKKKIEINNLLLIVAFDLLTD